jgi:hypothetical protein
MTYITILWTEDEPKFDIREHEQLKNAVLYLIQHGAQYTNQKIVTEVDWLPGDNAQPKAAPAQVTTAAKEEDPGPPPGTVMAGVDQPQVMDPTGMTSGGYRPPRPGQKSIFEGVLPPHVLGIVQNDD